MSGHDWGGGRYAADAPSDVERFLGAIRRRWWIVVVTALATAAVAWLSAPTPGVSYTARATLELQAPVSQFDDLTGTELNRQLQLLLSEQVAAGVVEDLGLDSTASEVLGQVEARPVGDAPLIQVSVTAGDAARATGLAQGFVERFTEFRAAELSGRIERLREELDRQISALQDRLDTLEATASPGDAEVDAVAETIVELTAIRAGLPVGEVDAADVGRVVRGADASAADTGVGGATRGLAGLLAGLVLGVALALARDWLDDRLHHEYDVEQAARGLPILARVPPLPRPATPGSNDATTGGRGPIIMLDDSDSPAAEAIRRLHAIVRGSTVTGKAHMLLVTGTGAGAGASTVAANLATAAALAGESVVLVDADLRTATISRWFGAPATDGLGSALSETDVPPSATPTSVPGLRLLHAGRTSQLDRQRLGSSRAGAVLDEVGLGADLVVVDAPEAATGADAAQLSRHADTVLVVCAFGRTGASPLRDAVDGLLRTSAQVSGLVLTYSSSRE